MARKCRFVLSHQQEGAQRSGGDAWLRAAVATSAGNPHHSHNNHPRHNQQRQHSLLDTTLAPAHLNSKFSVSSRSTTANTTCPAVPSSSAAAAVFNLQVPNQSSGRGTAAAAAPRCGGCYGVGGRMLLCVASLSAPAAWCPPTTRVVPDALELHSKVVNNAFIEVLSASSSSNTASNARAKACSSSSGSSSSNSSRKKKAAAAAAAAAVQRRRAWWAHQVSAPLEGAVAQVRACRSIVGGALAALVSRTLVAPLERVKMDLVLKNTSARGNALSVTAHVFAHEGLAGFWKGNALNLLRSVPFKALNFSAFDSYSDVFSRWTGKAGNMERFTAGACAGITATVVCFPLDLLRTRMLMTPGSGVVYGGPLATLVGILRHEGPSALYTGCMPALVGTAPGSAVFYGVYNLLKVAHCNRAREVDATLHGHLTGSSSVVGGVHYELPPLYTLLYGAIAGAASDTVTYPLEVIRRKMQVQTAAYSAALAAVPLQHAMARVAGAASGVVLRQASAVCPPSGVLAKPGVWTACAAIMRADGLAGFYAGILPNLLQVLPSAALSYWTFETVKAALSSGPS